MSDATDPFGRRDGHLYGPGPKRLLALDGGGVRGAISVAFLERIEKLLSEEQQKTGAVVAPGLALPPDPKQPVVRLGEWFDLIGGTSTGAIIAGALALGHSTADVKKFYLEVAARIFRRPFWRVPGIQSKFDAHQLRVEIDEIVKDKTLDSPDLITGLGIITKRMDTGSPWILANNRKAPYWETVLPKDGKRGHIGNKFYKLATLVRASTAAPHYFDPEILPIIEGAPMDPLGEANLGGIPWLSLPITKIRALYGLLSKSGPRADTHGLFVDGGVTPHNNPALALLMMAVLEPFGVRWPLGADKLTIISVGTGTYRTKLSFAELGFAGTLKLALRALVSLMGDTESLALAQMQWLGECPMPWEINSEIGTLANEVPPGGHWFRFLRYDVRLEPKWLDENLGLKFSEDELTKFQGMDDPGIVKRIYEIACMAADKQVKREHLFRSAGPGSA
jgi:hypothetical protein